MTRKILSDAMKRQIPPEKKEKQSQRTRPKDKREEGARKKKGHPRTPLS